MHRPWISALGLVGAAIFGTILGTGSTWAAGRPLLVVVEAQPGLGVDAGAVRQCIASELGQPVTSPRDPAAAETSDLLVVALDGGEIRMALREGGMTHVSRVIPDATDRAARLRVIAWLAGNLARDQVSAILPLRAPAISAAPPPDPADLSPASDRTATEPPPLPPVDPPAASLPGIRTQAGSDSRAPNARWAVTVAGGLTAGRNCVIRTCNAEGGMPYDTNYALELQHQIQPEGLIIGGALDAGPTSHLLGLVGFVGSRWQGRVWFAEANVGAGILTERGQAWTTTVSSTGGAGAQTTVSTQVQPALYGRAVGAIGFPIGGDLDLVARLGIHLASTGLATDFLSATAGVRLKLP